MEDFDWSASINGVSTAVLDAAFSLEFLAKHEHVLLVGPAGVGKSFLAQALGYSAIRPATPSDSPDDYFKTMTHQGRQLPGTHFPVLPRSGPAHPG